MTRTVVTARSELAEQREAGARAAEVEVAERELGHRERDGVAGPVGVQGERDALGGDVAGLEAEAEAEARRGEEEQIERRGGGGHRAPAVVVRRAAAVGDRDAGALGAEGDAGTGGDPAVQAVARREAAG